MGHGINPMTTMRISRRRMMKMSAGALLAAGLWPGALAAQDAAGGSFDFLWVNDLHFWGTDDPPFFERMVATMKKASPSAHLLIVGGDLTEKGTAEQFAGVGAILKTVGVPFKVVIGNHDWATQTERKPFLDAFADSLNY